jgi:hypothetical protein
MQLFKNPQDFFAGLLFAAFGAAALWFGQGYAFGTATRMGAGYLPTVLGWLLIGFGVFITLRSLMITGAPIPASQVRPQLFIIAGLFAFALLIERFGLLPATASVVILGSLASREMRWWETLVLAVFASGAAVALFIYGLGQPMEAWIWRF